MDKTKAQLTSLIPMSDNSPAIDVGQLIQRPPFDCFMDSAATMKSDRPSFLHMMSFQTYRSIAIRLSRISL